jgi:glycosyltransferase involved in cell wall biosynthesis
VTTVGVDVSALATPSCGGIGTSQYQTLRALAGLDAATRIVLYAARPPVVPFTNAPLDLPWPVRVGSGPFARSNIVWMQTAVNRLLALDHVSVFWGPRHLLPFFATGIGTVATVHDFWGRYHRGQQPWLNQVATRLLTDRVLARADLVVAPSSTVARDAERFGRRAVGSVRVVPWGVDRSVFHPLPPDSAEVVLKRLQVRRPFVLAVDVFNPRKGFATVLDAVAAARREGVQLSVVGLGRGRRSTGDAHPRERAARLGLREALLLPGDVATRDLVALYSSAVALTYPSVYEGFGMPVLEAMSCGCPVITADRSSLPEVAGGAALLVAPGSSTQLREAIITLTTDESARARLASAGQVRVERATWLRTAELMLAAFEDAERLRSRAGR